MSERKPSAKFVKWARSQRMSTRARVALEIMIEEGFVTTVRLKSMDYNHPPRVLADLKDAGVPFVMSRVQVEGEKRRVASYRLVDTMSGEGEASRKPIPKWFKDQLLDEWNHRCAICHGSTADGSFNPIIVFRFGSGVIRTSGRASTSCRCAVLTTVRRVGPARPARTGRHAIRPPARAATGHHLTPMSTSPPFRSDESRWW